MRSGHGVSVAADSLADMATTTPVRTRTSGDRCPGALRLHEAADGLLARVRLPGGLLTADQVLALTDAADTLGDGALSTTARGNIEIRGLAPEDAPRLQRVLAAAGLLPSLDHERVRNIVATPTAGLDGHGHAGDLTAAVRDLDRLLVSLPRTADLSGRFLFGLDDGRGDVLALDPDLAARWVSAEHAELVIGGTPALVIDAPDVPKLLVAAALAFLQARDAAGETGWRLADVAERTRIVAAVVDACYSAFPDALPMTESPGSPAGHADPAPLGPIGDHAAHLLLPLGQAPTSTWHALAGVARDGDGLVRTTPWRSLILAGLPRADRDDLLSREDLGLATSHDDTWSGVSACTGLPGCASSHADVRADVRAAAAQVIGTGELPVHVSGCDRRCGHPRRPHLEAVALPEGGYATARADGAASTGAPTGQARDPLTSLIGRITR